MCDERPTSRLKHKGYFFASDLREFLWRSKAEEVSRIKEFNDKLISHNNVLFRTMQQAHTVFRVRRGRFLRLKQNDDLDSSLAISALVIEMGKKSVKTDGVVLFFTCQNSSDLREPEGKQNINIKER